MVHHQQLKMMLTKVKITSFRATFIDSFQGKIIAKYTTDNLKAKKVVLYYDNSSDYAKGIAEAFKKSYKGEIVATKPSNLRIQTSKLLTKSKIKTSMRLFFQVTTRNW